MLRIFDALELLCGLLLKAIPTTKLIILLSFVLKHDGCPNGRLLNISEGLNKHDGEEKRANSKVNKLTLIYIME